MDKISIALAFAKSWGLYLLEILRGLSFKSQATIAVAVTIVGFLIMFGTPDRKTVAKALPDYATPADISKATASMQRDIDNLTSDLHQMRIELNAVETKLAEPAKITTGSNPAKKKRH